jgi:hypothetical protein
MKELFVNKVKTNSMETPSIIPNSVEMKSRRYYDCFYKHNVMEMYTWLNFFSVKYKFDIEILLELLLENLYNNDKIDTFVFQMAQIEENEEFSNFYYTIQKIVLEQYMASKNVSQEIKNSVFDDLIFLLDTHIGMLLLNHDTWSLEFLYAKKQKVRFYSNEMVIAKLKKIFTGMFLLQRMPQVFVDFLRYMKEKRFLHDSGTNKQVEEILSRYYLMHLKDGVLYR